MKTPQIFRKYRDKIRNFFKNIGKNDDFKDILSFLGHAALYGFILNVALLNFGLILTWYSWIGWGFLIWLIEFKLIPFIRAIRWR